MAVDFSGPFGPGSAGSAPGPRWGLAVVPAVLIPIVLATSPSPASEAIDDYHSAALERVERSVTLIRPEKGEQGDHRRRWLTWRVEYRLRNSGREPLLVEPETIFCTVEGWTSNARAEGHGLPRRADHALSVGEELESTVPLIEHDDPTRACAERATLQVWADRLGSPLEPSTGASCEPITGPIRLEPGEILGVRLRLEHRHHLHGPTEPLLGDRELILRIGPTAFRDKVELDGSIPPDREMDQLSAIPDERRDPRFYYSQPDSLYLDAALSGFRSFQFRDLKVPRDTPMRLSFRYFRSTDSTGQVRAELKQYQDVPNAYRVLTEAKRTEQLDELGEWVLVDRLFRSEAVATTMQLRFLIDCEGEGPSAIWIDDVVLEPIDRPAE